MNTKMIIAVGLLILILSPIRAEDYLKAAQEENSPFVKTSSDHRVKVTIIYVGPLKEKFLDYVFAVIYLAEDCSSDEQYKRNTSENPAPAGRVSMYDLFPSCPVVKDGSHHDVGHPGGNCYQYKNALVAQELKERYPTLKIPTADHPDRARVYQCFYKSILTGPFDITLDDHIPAYGQNSFHFRDIDVGSFPSN